MTVGNVYEGNLIEDFLIDIERYDENHYAKILKNGVELTSGLLEQGMMVQVYHGDELYGAYTVDELLTPYPQTNSLLRSSNSYGFILPIDGTILKDSPAGNITSHFGYRNGENHLGIDIADFPLTDKYYYSLGRPIRAVKSGTVIRSRYEEGGYGHYVYIDHGEGLRTLYAHMQYTPLVSLNQYVEQGDIIGHVGASGGVTGVHLHFEVIENGKEVDPIPYLTGASTYNPTPITYTVTYNANGGTSAPSAQTKTHDVLMTLSNVKPIRDGYDFYGWATSPTATTPTYQSGSSYTANENITLYAVWVIPKVKNMPNINRTYGAYCLGNSIEFGIRNNIMEGEYIISPNGKYIAIMQGDGNFVVYNADTYLWASGTQATLGKGNFVQINPDGNIVIYHSEDISKHKLLAQGAKKLSITDSGVLEAFNSVGNVVWSSESRGLYPHDTFTFDYIVKVEDKNISQLNRTNGKYCVGSALTTDMRLNVNEYLASPNGEFIAVMQRDGNFVVYNKERYLWATGTAGSIHEEYYLVVQGDGNIVLYDDTLPEGEKAQWNLWGMIPSTNKAVRLELENDGRLVARNNYTGNTPKGDAIWVSRPGGGIPMEDQTV